MTSNDALTVSPRDITSAIGFVGRSSTAAGQQFRGRIKDLRVYPRVLTTEQVRALSDAAAPGNLAELVASVELGDTSAVTRDLSLPTLPGVTWSTSDPAVVTAQGEVIRPAAGQGDATRHAEGHVHAPRASPTPSRSPITVKQRVAIPPDQLRAGLAHFYKLDETAGTTLADSGSGRRRGHRHARQPRQGHAHRRRRHAQPRRLRRRADAART